MQKQVGTLGDDDAHPKRSVARLFEDGVELGPAHSTHADIRTLGLGRFSHWYDPRAPQSLRFSASNNSNPARPLFSRRGTYSAHHV